MVDSDAKQDKVDLEHRQSYLAQLQQSLTNHFKNKIDNQDDHHVLIYTNSSSSNVYVTYIPKWLVDHHDNTGDVIPPRTVIILGKYSKQAGKIVNFSNQQFIHAQHFTDKQYLLNFNYRNQNGLSAKAQKKLSTDLQTKYQIVLKSDGTLVSNVMDNPVKALVKLIQALQYLNNYGDQYLVSVKDVKKQAYADITAEQAGIKEAKDKLLADNRKYSTHSKSKSKKKSDLPKAPGRTTNGYSSTTGTKWAQDAAKEAKAKDKQKAKQHRTQSKSKHGRKLHKMSNQKFTLRNKYVATSGRFKRPLKQIRSLISKNGGIPQRLLTQQTAYLVCDKPNKTRKYQTAVKWGIPVIPESKLE